jgi:hypothetical protein
MWLPLVMTSTPDARIASAVDGVRPMPPATFSPFAVTKSMPRCLAELRQDLLDGDATGLADHVARSYQDAGPPRRPGASSPLAGFPGRCPTDRVIHEVGRV